MRKKSILEIHVNDKYLVTDDIFTTKKNNIFPAHNEISRYTYGKIIYILKRLKNLSYVC